MITKILIIFPYSGFDEGDKRETLFWQLVDSCQSDDVYKPIIVLNRDTEKRGKAKAFLDNPRSASEVSIHRCWAVDTCQMWLSGWGLILDDPTNNDDDRVVQLPGDIDTVNSNVFFTELDAFINHGGNHDIVIGDFASEDMFSAKELIDLYGTYALMANWFPDVAQACRQDPSKVLDQVNKTRRQKFFKLNRLRSEFLNIRIGTLNSLLKVRKFAYEQTLNMLIRSWDHTNKDWKYKITKMDLGVISDDNSFRKYQDCLDQIERTERMLKLLWREIYESRYPNQQDFIDEYDQLDRRSTSIRESARITIQNILGLVPR